MNYIWLLYFSFIQPWLSAEKIYPVCLYRKQKMQLLLEKITLQVRKPSFKKNNSGDDMKMFQLYVQM